jgi:hypothetical protein
MGSSSRQRAAENPKEVSRCSSNKTLELGCVSCIKRLAEEAWVRRPSSAQRRDWVVRLTNAGE